ncbi:MAG: helix-turn-helix domain-containing protein [Pirellulales bacterium]
MSENLLQKQTPPQIAKRWGVSTDKVLAWIRSGELPAIDASTRRGGRPRYLVDVSDLAEFESRRAVVPRKPQPARRQCTPVGVRNYF